MKYSTELKAEVVRLYTEEKFKRLPDCIHAGDSKQDTKHEQGKTAEDLRGKTAWRKGRPKTKFASMEEELPISRRRSDAKK